MINVAIVDDEPQVIAEAIKYFEKLQKEVREEFSVSTFQSGEELLLHYDSEWDLICLDIDLGGMDGMDLAREIRKKNERVQIMFVTNMAQMAVQGYEVRAIDFLVKPVDYYSFALKMKNTVNVINARKNRNIVLITANGVQKISSDELFYVEVDGHYLFFHTADSVYRQKASMTELEEKLEGLSFKRCNNCYLVNLKYVDGVDRDSIIIGNARLKISRPRKKEFMQALVNYMGGIQI